VIDVDPVIASAFRLKLLIFTQDHEQNCSTLTVRIVGSSQALAFMLLSSRNQFCPLGTTSRWANQSVIGNGLKQIKAEMGGDG